MNALALALLACSVVGCGELPRAEPVAAPAKVEIRECAGSVELRSNAPMCLIARDENGPCFWRCR